jgi:2'-5' RNA ligase
MMRVFVAVEITNNEIIDSIKEFQKDVKIDAKPVELKNLHFTLQFLGEISEEIAQKIIQSLKTVEFSSFDVNLLKKLFNLLKQLNFQVLMSI